MIDQSSSSILLIVKTLPSRTRRKTSWSSRSVIPINGSPSIARASTVRSWPSQSNVTAYTLSRIGLPSARPARCTRKNNASSERHKAGGRVVTPVNPVSRTNSTSISAPSSPKTGKVIVACLPWILPVIIACSMTAHGTFQRPETRRALHKARLQYALPKPAYWPPRNPYPLHIRRSQHQ
jgi:hypothetical protein